ncbi:hypothetical protein BOV89_12865, partial [Solemya velum gill symbiont]|uniref:hypothetical protein n=1 Tax=Solemya velum gill symbiont TaxID=2340 RepID=UPI0009CA2A70
MINIEDTWKETLADNAFYCDDTDTHDNQILIFATDDNFRRLSYSEIVFDDDTFYSYPRLFKQLYTLHASRKIQHFLLTRQDRNNLHLILFYVERSC